MRQINAKNYTIIDSFPAKDGTIYVIMQYGNEDKYMLSTALNYYSHLKSWKEIEEEKEKLINRENIKSEETTFEEISNIAYMPADEYIPGYHYNKLTGKIIKYDE